MDLRVAAERLGVHYQTAYRWVREGLLDARKVGHAYEVPEQAVERLRADRARAAPPPVAVRVRDWPTQQNRLRRALLHNDEVTGRQVVDRLARGGVPTVDLCSNLFTPALRSIGEAWAQGQVSVAEEHRASAMAERLLYRCAVHPSGRPRGVAVVATAPGEEHGLPGLMAAMVLRVEHWVVHHLGTEVPAADVAALAQSVAADVVVLSYAWDGAAEPTADASAHLRSAGVPTLVGRPGATLPDLLHLLRTLDGGARSGGRQASAFGPPPAPRTAWAAASRAIGTRNGEQDT